MPAIARLGDFGSHGGVIETAAERTWCEGRRVARVGDIYGCPVHGPNRIVEGSAKLRAEGNAVARIGDHTECGAEIATGAARSYDE